MFRKLIIALSATAALSAVALAPTTASAWHPHHHWHGHGWGWGGFGAGVATGLIATSAYAPGPACYVVRRWVDTPYGLKLRRIVVC